MPRADTHPKPRGASADWSGERGELADLVSRLGRWLDEKRYRDAGETAAILAEYAVISTLGGEATGLDAIRAQAARGHDAFVTQHQITNTLIDVHDGGASATIRANLEVVFAQPGVAGAVPEAVFTLGEVYRLTAERGPAGWRLARVALEPLWKIGDRPRPTTPVA
jgi:hypothetical protein